MRRGLWQQQGDTQDGKQTAQESILTDKWDQPLTAAVGLFNDRLPIGGFRSGAADFEDGGNTIHVTIDVTGLLGGFGFRLHVDHDIELQDALMQ